MAAEHLVAEEGIEAVSVRAVAGAAGTSTRAVYALFGSREELIQALAHRAFELVMEQVAAVPLTDAPGADLIACAVQGFRRFALDHPDLFRLFFTAQRPALSTDSQSARVAALQQLILRVERVRAAGLVGGHPVEETVLLWDAMCCGLAIREICGPINRADGERIWTDALTALLAGLGMADKTRIGATPPGKGTTVGQDGMKAWI